MNLHNEISKVAFELYRNSGMVEDHDLDNWLEAEKIVMERYKKKRKDGCKNSYSKEKGINIQRYLQVNPHQKNIILIKHYF